MARKNKRILFWSTSFSDLLLHRRIGGIGVQIMFWATAFYKNNWSVYSLYENKRPPKYYPNNCTFIQDWQAAGWKFGLYIFYSLFLIIRIRPKVVICRGGRNRNLLFVALWCRILRIKLIQFCGSDADLASDYSKLSNNVQFNIKLFRLGLKYVKYIVVQNKYQKQLLETQYKNKRVIIIPNIWDSSNNVPNLNSRNLILWVGNTRKLKRPQWVFEIARALPNEQFVMIGGDADHDVYNECLSLTKKYPNVLFLGGLPFEEVNNWFSKAKVLLCTSEYEGFPNTFLQAWANNIPVLSTVDPSNLIADKNLGFVCKSITDFQNLLAEVMKPDVYKEKEASIKRYFSDAHSMQSNFERLRDFIEC